jgi:hypothetical protein
MVIVIVAPVGLSGLLSTMRVPCRTIAAVTVPTCRRGSRATPSTAWTRSAARPVWQACAAIEVAGAACRATGRSPRSGGIVCGLNMRPLRRPRSFRPGPIEPALLNRASWGQSRPSHSRSRHPSDARMMPTPVSVLASARWSFSHGGTARSDRPAPAPSHPCDKTPCTVSAPRLNTVQHRLTPARPAATSRALPLLHGSPRTTCLPRWRNW